MINRLAGQIRRTSVGIAVEPDAIRFSRSVRGSVVASRTVGLPAGVDAGAPGFGKYLRQELARFAPGWRRCSLWLCSGVNSLQMRHLSVQKVKAGALPNLAYWTFRKDLPFDAKRSVFDFGQEPLGEEAKWRLTAYTASRSDVEEVAQSLGEAGVRLTGIVIPAFAMRAVLADYSARKGDEVWFGVHAGEDVSTAVVMSAGRMMSARVFKTGMNTVFGMLRERYAGQPLAEVYPKLAEGDGTEDRELVESVVDRFGQQLDRTMSAYLSEHRGARVAGLVVMGSLGAVPDLVGRLKEALGVPAIDTITDVEAPALLSAGASLARIDETPNLLFPAARRARVNRWSWYSLVLALVLGGLTLAFSVMSGVLRHANEQLGRKVEAAEAALAVYQPKLSEAMLAPMVADVEADQLEMKRMAKRWLVPAVIQSLAGVTPDEIHPDVLNLLTDAPNPGKGGRRALIQLNGRVVGEGAQQRSVLAAYALTLEGVSLFERAEVKEATESTEDDIASLLFKMEITLRPDIGALHEAESSAKEVL